jgi:hypothetical protein
MAINVIQRNQQYVQCIAQHGKYMIFELGLTLVKCYNYHEKKDSNVDTTTHYELN